MALCYRLHAVPDCATLYAGVYLSLPSGQGLREGLAVWFHDVSGALVSGTSAIILFFCLVFVANVALEQYIM